MSPKSNLKLLFILGHGGMPTCVMQDIEGSVSLHMLSSCTQNCVPYAEWDYIVVTKMWHSFLHQVYASKIFH